MKIVSLPGRLARVLPLAACLFALNASAATFTDPIKNGQDPQILAKDGWFYLIQASGASIALYKSQTVSGLATAAKTTIFTPPTGGPGQPASGSGVWAPELHWLDAENRWYLYYSLPPPASDTSGADRWVWGARSAVGAAPDALTYAATGAMFTGYRNIDGNMFKGVGGRLFFLFAGKPTPGGDAKICIATMSDGATLSSAPVVISAPTNAWERFTQTGFPHVNEGPYGFTNNGNTYITFSANYCGTDQYCLGLLTLTPFNADPMTPSSWVKSSGPVFSQGPGAFGTGHNAVFADADGGWWNVYHANPSAGQGCGGSRKIRIQHIYWNPNGAPDFGVPVPDPATVSEAATGQKLLDDFESDAVGGGASGWTVDTGTWAVASDGGHVYKQSASGGGVAHTHAADGTWADYSAQVDIKPLTLGSGTISLSVRFQDTSNRYIAVLSSSAITIKKATTAGGQVQLATAAVSLLSTGAWTSNVTFVVNGSTLQVFVDGVFVVGATDTTFSSGGVGLSTSGGATAEFDNVTVREP